MSPFRYVVGIVAGEGHTSIAARQVLANNTGFVRGWNGSTRFPSSMYVGYEEYGGSIQFGAAAERYDEAMKSLGRDEGIFVKELETSHREDNDRFVGMSGGRFTRRKLLRIYFCELKSLIDGYFQETFGFGPEQTDVLYYVALPVLDKEQERYRKQLHETQIAVEGDPEVPGDRGPFPKGRVEYVSRPASAVLYMLDCLRVAGTCPEGNCRVCVVDSGVARTDVCVVGVSHASSAEPEFAVLSAASVGIGSQDCVRLVISYLGEHRRAAWQDIARGAVGMRIDAYISELISALTRTLGVVRDKRQTTDVAELERVSVLLAEVFSKGGDEAFSKLDLDIALDAMKQQFTNCVIEAVQDAELAMQLCEQDSPRYLLATGENSLVPTIRQWLLDLLPSECRQRALPLLVGSGSGSCSPLDKLIITESEEISAIREAVARGSVLWSGSHDWSGQYS